MHGAFTSGINSGDEAVFAGRMREGFCSTPKETVDRMVDRLFHKRRPAADALILDPGCGEGEFIEGICVGASGTNRASLASSE